MSFRVRVLRRADREVQEILRFIGEERNAPEGARAWYRAYEAALDRLARVANTLGLAPENEFVDYEIRQILFRTRKGKTYRGLFTIVDDEVRLLHVRGPGQDVMTKEQMGRSNHS
jgi:plasmid stabilization system protein ParE